MIKRTAPDVLKKIANVMVWPFAILMTLLLFDFFFLEEASLCLKKIIFLSTLDIQ